MPWPIRSPLEASQRLRGAFRQYMPGTDSALKNNFVTVIVKVIAVLAHEFELRMGLLSKQMFISTATGQWLVRRCADIGIYRKPAAAASGVAIGTGSPSTAYPAGIRLISGSTVYISTAEATADGDGDISLPIAAETAGSAGNRDADGLMALADPVLYPDLSSEWTVGPDGLGGGADLEDLESLRARGLQRQQNPPGAGTLTDYERIALGVPGVFKAWAYRVPNAPGSILLLFLFQGRDGGIPESGDVAAVQAAIDAARLIRVDDSVAAAPAERIVDVEISGLSGDTPDIRAQIAAAIAAMFLARCRPGIVGDTFTLSRSWISEAISGVTGEDRHVLVAPAADIVLTSGQFPVLGDVDYA
ncbi:baseplate J/gp47 family protein [Rhizobium sp. RU36D]|uniref:baseplate J/gp47 family protein n=1 Tax=Rhizobium sp. RU36D TaxID=1907415 RepID=UPI0009D874A0|nr:baseplate J/gp47 family protein [Rhizobium sp. RU36D]SMD18426.1 Uncharacterized phage protein gp47/JayE [Rhizobium sp. RU36D]